MIEQMERPRRRMTTLASRLFGLAALPTVMTAIALLTFLFLLTRVGGTGSMPAGVTLVAGTAVILAAGVLGALLASRRMARAIADPVEDLIESLEKGELEHLAPRFRRDADWELRVLYHRLLLQMRRRSASPLSPASPVSPAPPPPSRPAPPGSPDLHEAVTRIVACIDRIGTEAPPGDAIAGLDGLEPIGSSLRALIERLDQRDHELSRLLGRLGEAVSELGREVEGAAESDEGAFIALLEIVAELRESRQHAGALLRELAAARQAPDPASRLDRIRGMAERFGDRLDRSLATLGEISSRLESDAARRREIAHRGRPLELEIDDLGVDQADRLAGSRSDR